MGEKEDTEKLFLFEAVVDDLTISESTKASNTNLSDTCVFFQFFNYPPLVICESDFIGSPPGNSNRSHVTFKAGKSCFFALRIPKRPILLVTFDLRVSVKRKVKEGIHTATLDIGNATIDMSIAFTELLREQADYESDNVPLSKIKKGMFEIKDSNGKSVGQLAAFVRLSCFGKQIITQFSPNKDNENTYLFKGLDVGKFGQQSGEEEQLRIIKDNNQPISQYPSYIYKSSNVDSDDVKGHSSKKRPLRREEKHDRFSDGDYYSRISKRPRLDNDRSMAYPRPDTEPLEYTKFKERRPCLFNCDCLFSNEQPNSTRPPSRSGEFPCGCPHLAPTRNIYKYAKTQSINPMPGVAIKQNDQDLFHLPLKRVGDALTERDKIVDSTVYYKLTSEEVPMKEKQVDEVHIKPGGAPGQSDGQDVLFLVKLEKKIDADTKRQLYPKLTSQGITEPTPRMVDQGSQFTEDGIPELQNKNKGNEKSGPKKSKSTKK